MSIANKCMTKYIFVTGGVMSGVGKGVATSSIGALLQARGFSVTAVKIDPYINVDAGTMNPVEHGEVFVTVDGVECDQDIGNYERFLNRELSSTNYMTTGRVYSTVIERERNLEYGGKSVEVVPHIPHEVIRRIKKAGREASADFVIIEIGGTVGEYQNLIFLEAARMMHLQAPKDIMHVIVSYLPHPPMIGEMKTKPTQYAVRTLNSAGIQPDIIIARSEHELDEPRKQKIATFCNMREENIISAPDIKTSIYEIPINFEREGIGKIILKHFDIRNRKANMKQWEKLVHTINRPKHKVKIGIVGKYFESGKFILADSYISVIEAIKHASWSKELHPEIEWLNSEMYEKNPKKLKELKKYHGIIVPGGFGARGVEGKIAVAGYCRENKIPYLGLCYGMQIAAIDFARNVCGIKNAHTTEVKKHTKDPVIDVMPEQKVNLKDKNFGATMRLGQYLCDIKPRTKTHQIYSKQKQVLERHRHRYEFNNDYRELMVKKGLIVSGLNPEKDLVEIIELKNHPFFIGTQFHPEFQSTPFVPHPLFSGFITASSKHK